MTENTHVMSLEDAISFASMLHSGQKDKSGLPYILHVLRVMLNPRLKTNIERITAVLHDVVEHCGISFDGLLMNGCPAEIVDALRFLTKTKEEEYVKYIERICSGPLLVLKVKRADLEDNMDKSRIPNPSEKDLARISKYRNAYGMIIQEIGNRD